MTLASPKTIAIVELNVLKNILRLCCTNFLYLFRQFILLCLISICTVYSPPLYLGFYIIWIFHTLYITEFSMVCFIDIMLLMLFRHIIMFYAVFSIGIKVGTPFACTISIFYSASNFLLWVLYPQLEKPWFALLFLSFSALILLVLLYLPPIPRYSIKYNSYTGLHSVIMCKI